MRRLILVRPDGPRNVGTTLRAAANFGPVELVLVTTDAQPLLDHPDFEQMAHGVEDRASKVRVEATLEEALTGCTWSVGFTARLRDHVNVEDWRAVRVDVAKRSRREGERVAFVLGNEKDGLRHEDTACLNQMVRIATSDAHDSLNLGVAAALVLYDTADLDAKPAGGNRCTSVRFEDREFLKAHVRETLATQVPPGSTREDIERSIERLFSRADLETRDARAWHALMRQLGNHRSPPDYGIKA